MSRGSRNYILERIRAAKPHGVKSDDLPYPLPDTGSCDESELLDRLEKNLKSTSTALCLLRDRSELGETLFRAFDELGARRAVIFSEEIPGGDLIRDSWSGDTAESLSCEVFFGIDTKVVKEGGVGGFLDSIDVCVTGCNMIVAEGGVCAIDSSSESGRLASLLPPHHIVVARRTDVVPRLDDLMESISFGTNRERSSFILISGPSRTADIEKRLVLGVHGPLSLTVILLPVR